MITPYTPTPEELAESERTRAHRAFSTEGATTGSPAPAAAAPGQPPPRPPLDECLITAADLALLKIPPRPALLDRWMCESDLGYIFAPRGVGKTWMAMALPGAISRGTALGLWGAGTATRPEPSADGADAGSTSGDLLGADLDPPSDFTPVPILYVDGEMPLKLTQYRNNGLKLDLSHVTYLHHEHMFEIQTRCINIGDAEDRERLTSVVTRLGYKVLILDNLSALASGIDENKGMDYEPIAHWLLELRRRKITVIVVHHAGRSGAMRGHSKREDACSWILELRDARQDGDPGVKFISHFAKPSRNTGDPLPDLLWHFTTDKASGITDIKCELGQVSDYEQFIRHVCEGVTKQADIAEMMGKNKGTVSKWARKALQEYRLSGSVHKLLPPKEGASKHAAKIRVHASDDDIDLEDEDEDDDC